MWYEPEPQDYYDSGSSKASLFDNSDILRVIPHDGKVAGKPLWYELSVWGGLIQVTREEDVSIIKKELNKFRQMLNNGTVEANEEMKYLTWTLKEEYGW